MLLDTITEPISDAELAELKQHATERLELWKRRALISGAALAMTCAPVVLFTREGSSISPIGRILDRPLILLSMGLLVVFVNCAALFWGARQAVHDIETGDLDRPL
jgi:uncharacterized membrane protein YvlD (DUF360 family)